MSCSQRRGVPNATEIMPLATIDRMEGQPPGPYARLTVSDTGLREGILLDAVGWTPAEPV